MKNTKLVLYSKWMLAIKIHTRTQRGQMKKKHWQKINPKNRGTL